MAPHSRRAVAIASDGPAPRRAPAPPPVPPLELRLLGPLTLTAADGTRRPLPRKSRALLAYLATHRGRTVPRDHLGALLWSNGSTDRARQSLRQSLVAVRAALGAAADSALVVDGNGIALRTDAPIGIDVAVFDRLSASRDPAELEDADRLFRGEFLEGLDLDGEPFAEWLEMERERLRSRRLDTLQRLAEAQDGAGQSDAAIAIARRLVDADPLREEAHRLLMRLLAAAGRRGEALRQFASCVDILKSELGVEPDEETSRLGEAIRSGAASAQPARPVPTARADLPRPPPDAPSIIVLPFTSLGDGPAQDYFTDGIVEDLTVALGRERWLFVMAGGTAAVLRDEAGKARLAAAQIGIRYILHGSVRRDGDRVRVAARATEAATGRQLWSELIDDVVDNVFAIQRRLTISIAAAAAPAVRAFEITRAQRKPTESLTAYDLYLRALPRFRNSASDNAESLRLLRRAIAIDPLYSTAYAMAARCYQFQWMFRWVGIDDPNLVEGVRLARLAVETGPDDSEALWMSGLVILFLGGEAATGAGLIARSLDLNPSSAHAWIARSLAHAFLGDGATALDAFEQGQRLNPLDSLHHFNWFAATWAEFAAGRWTAATAAADRALAQNARYLPALRMKVVTSGLAGPAAVAHEAVRRLLAADPGATVAALRAFMARPLAENPAALATYVEGLRRAGLPEA